MGLLVPGVLIAVSILIISLLNRMSFKSKIIEFIIIALGLSITGYGVYRVYTTCKTSNCSPISSDPNCSSCTNSVIIIICSLSIVITTFEKIYNLTKAPRQNNIPHTLPPRPKNKNI